MEVRDLETAQHEAAHVVVGAAVGLRLVRAVVVNNDVDAGWAWFDERSRRTRREAWALMYAAGPAWERMLRAPGWRASSRPDMALLAEFVSGRHGAEVAIRAATALLAGLTREHARVTRALLERDLTGRDLAALCRGERLDADG